MLSPLKGAALAFAPGRTPDLGNVESDVLQRWERVQKRFGKDLGISSGFRDPTRNANAGGAKKSQHMHGKALDIDVRGLPIEERKRLIEAASAEGFTGIGVYDNALHFDTGPRRFWGPSYKSNSLPGWASGTIKAHMAGLFKDTKVADAGTITREQYLEEAKRRGLIKDEPTREQYLEEARRRGLIPKDTGDAERIREKAAIESAVGQVLAEDGRDPKVVADENAARDLRLSYAEPEPVKQPSGSEPIQDPSLTGIPPQSPDAIIAPTDFLMPTVPGVAISAIRRFIPDEYKGFFDTIVKGSTYGWSDEMTGTANALVSGTEGETFSEERRRFIDAQRASDDQFREKNPALATGAEISGALATAPLFAYSAPAGTMARVGLGAAEGAGVGAVAAAGDARTNEEVPGAMVRGSIGGAITGAALTRAGIAVERYLNNRAARSAAPTLEQARAAASRMIQDAENSGVVYHPTAVSRLYTELTDAMGDQYMTRGVHKKTYALMRGLEDYMTGNQPVTLGRLARLRTLASDAMMEAKTGSADARLARMARDMIDDFSLDTGNMIAAGSGAAQRAEGSRLWHQFRKAEKINELMEDAALSAASTGSGGNVNNAIRQKFRNFWNNRKNRIGFTPEEAAAVENVIRQGFTADSLRLLGKLSPEGNGLSLMLNLGAAGATGGTSLVATAAGVGAKRIADGITQRRARDVFTTIINGGNVPQSRLAALTRAERRALTRALAQVYGGDVGEAAAGETIENSGFLKSLAGTGTSP